MDFLASTLWQLSIAAIGAFVGIAQIKALRRERASCSLPAWNAKPHQVLAFGGFSVLCILVVPILCSSVAHHLFPTIDFKRNVLYLIPPIQTLALATLIFAIKIFPDAFPRALNAPREKRAQRWLSLKNYFGVPAFFSLSLFLVLSSGLLVGAIVYFLPESVQGVFQKNQLLVNAFINSESLFITVLCVPAIAILTPILEELIFRGGLYLFLKSKISAIPAAVFSSVIFALMHDAPISYLPLTLLGCVLCFAYEKTGRITAPILIHALFNANTLVAIALSREETRAVALHFL